VNCYTKIDKEDGIAWIQQSLLINFNAKFGEESMAMQGHGTAGTPRFKIQRPNDKDKIPIAGQS
jgi:hypothetical protein